MSVTDLEWRNLQADKWAAERHAEEAVRSANSWREEAKRLERERDALRAENERLREALKQIANPPNENSKWYVEPYDIARAALGDKP